MKKLFICAGSALLLMLEGCSAITGLETLAATSVSPNQVYLAGNTLVAVEATANQYDSLPLCPISTGICRTPAGTRAIGIAIRAAHKAFVAMDGYVDANPGAVVPVSLYNTAVTALSALQSAVTQYNVKN